MNIASSKNDFENNAKRIQELEEQLKEVQNSFGEKLPSELTEEQAKIVAELKREQTPIYRQRTILTNRLNALINNQLLEVNVLIKQTLNN